MNITVENLDVDALPLELCHKRLHRAERLIGAFLEAHDDSEMSNEQEVIERLRRFLEET